MKFKEAFNGFDYDQRAIDTSKDLKGRIEEFIEDLELIKHSDECINQEGIDKLLEAIEVLDDFYISYKALASRKIKDFYDNKRGQ